MNWRPFRCIFGVHDLTQWRTLKPTDNYQRRVLAAVRAEDWIPRVNSSIPADSPVSERHCKRLGCGYFETKPLKPRKRAPTSADTISPKV